MPERAATIGTWPGAQTVDFNSRVSPPQPPEQLFWNPFTCGKHPSHVALTNVEPAGAEQRFTD